MPRSQYQKDMQAYIERIMKEDADKEKSKEERKKTYSFRKHLEDKRFIKNKDSAIDDEPFSNFNNFLDRKKEMNSNE